MATTSPDSISYPDASYTSGFVAAMAAMASSIQTALSKRGRKSYQWADSTARGAQAGMSTGDMGYQVDTALLYRYNGSAWKAWESDWTAYTATLTNFTIGTGGAALNSTDYKYDSGRLRVRWRLYLGSSGQSVGSQVVVTMPSGATLRAPSTAGLLMEGKVTLFQGGTTNLGHVRYSSSNTDRFEILANAATAGGLAIITSTVPWTWAAGNGTEGELLVDVQ